MRYSRIIAAIVLSSALIFSLCITAFAAPAVVDPLYCDSGVAYFIPLNSSSGKWVDYEPTLNDERDVFKFSNLPNTLVDGNYEYSFKSFAFLLYPTNYEVEFESGYIYTYTFTIKSTRVSDPTNVGFEFGVCESGFLNAYPLADVVYTYTTTGASTVTYCITATVHVDDTLKQSIILDPDSAYLYLNMTSEWSSAFTLTASYMNMRKAVGEDAYYQASLDAIENLPDSEYNYILNKMPDAEGELTVMSGELLDIMAEFSPELKRGRDLFTSDLARPCVYLPDIDIPFLKIHVMDKGVRYLDTYLNEMNPMILEWIAVVLNFVRLVVCVTFFTSTWYKMARIEWWY